MADIRHLTRASGNRAIVPVTKPFEVIHLYGTESGWDRLKKAK